MRAKARETSLFFCSNETCGRLSSQQKKSEMVLKVSQDATVSDGRGFAFFRLIGCPVCSLFSVVFRVPELFFAFVRDLFAHRWLTRASYHFAFCVDDTDVNLLTRQSVLGVFSAFALPLPFHADLSLLY